MSEWRDINTAPNDEEVLIFCPDANEPRVMSAAYIEFVDKFGALISGGWKHSWQEDGRFIDVAPTHWMPLPEPPHAPDASSASSISAPIATAERK